MFVFLTHFFNCVFWWLYTKYCVKKEMIKTLDDLSVNCCWKALKWDGLDECLVFMMSKFEKVTAPAKDHLTHWNPQKLLCTVCLQVAVAIAQNFGVHKYFM